MLPENLQLIHFLSNIVSGLSFFGVALAFSVFIDRIKLRLDNDKNKEFWVQINQMSYLFSIISMVFLFCGLGHLVEAFTPWTTFYGYVIIVHCCTASFGSILILLLVRALSKK